MLTVKLYERAGTYIKDLPTVLPVTIQASKDREIRRTARFTMDKAYLSDLKKIGRRIKITDDDSNQVFAGYIDDVDTRYGSDAWIDVSCRDNAKVFERAGFVVDVTYEDTSYTDTTRTVTSAAGSSEMAAGDAIQRQGKVYGRKLQATVLGITSEVNPDSESNNILEGSYSIGYSATGLTLLTLTVYVDLLAQETLQGLTLTTNGAEISKKISTDGSTFTTFSAGATGRYLEIVITKASGPITAGIVATANGAHPASNALDDDIDVWRPRPADIDRELILNFASAAVNGLNIKCGVSDLDRETAYLADIYYDSSGSWALAKADAFLLCGFNEVCFDSVTTTRLKLHFKKKNAPVAVRYVIPIYCDSTATLDQIIETILATEGEADFTRIKTTRRAPAGHAITYLAGQKKLKACVELADSINFEFFYDSDERPVLRPKRWASPLDDLTKITAHLEWSARLTDAEIYNVILAIYEAGDAQYFSVATNNSGASGTSTVNIGTRTSEVLRNPLANTQAKLDAWAQEKLAEMTRQSVAGTTRIGALNTNGDLISIESGQILRITDPATDESGLYEVIRCDMAESETTYDWSLEVVTL